MSCFPPPPRRDRRPAATMISTRCQRARDAVSKKKKKGPTCDPSTVLYYIRLKHVIEKSIWISTIINNTFKLFASNGTLVDVGHFDRVYTRCARYLDSKNYYLIILSRWKENDFVWRKLFPLSCTNLMIPLNFQRSIIKTKHFLNLYSPITLFYVIRYCSIHNNSRADSNFNCL